MPIDDISLVANLLFSETKDPNDAVGIIWVIKNRMSNPKRFGRTLSDVIFQSNQFSGVGSKEWNKAVKGKFTPDELSIYNQMTGIAKKVLSNEIPDPTGGADHYVNLDISNPSWTSKMNKKTKIGQHTYFKE